jgi:hypothetical protein
MLKAIKGRCKNGTVERRGSIMKGKMMLISSLLLILSTPSHADLIPHSRYDTILVTAVNSNDFSGVVGNLTNHQEWTGTPGSTYAETFDSSWASPGAWSWTCSSNMSITNANYNVSTGVVSADFKLLSGTSATSSLQRDISGTVPPLAQIDGYYTIEGVWSGYGGAYGGRYTIEAILPGDWSGEGPGVMKHLLLYINPDWSIEKNFIYNGSTTTFLAWIDNYRPENHLMDANLFVRLYGAAVPTPGPTPKRIWIPMLFH